MATEGARNRFAEHSGYSSQTGVAGLKEVTEFVHTNPTSSVLMAFGLGFGIGLAIGAMIGEPEPPSRSQRYLGNAEKLGRQILDAITGVLPDSLTPHRS